MEGALVPFEQMKEMAKSVAKSGLFGVQTDDQALSLMLLSQGLGQHPMIAVMEYHIIQGRPAKKAEAVLAKFQQRGGIVEWLEYTPKKVTGKFYHPKSCPVPVTITWTIEQASKITSWSKAKNKDVSLTEKDNWINYPAAMLRSRCIAEGVRTVDPASMQGVLVAEEAEDIQEIDQNARPVIEPPKKVENAEIALNAPTKGKSVKTASKAVEAEIVQPNPVKPTQDEVLQPAPQVNPPEKAQKTVKERLANAKKLLGDKEYKAYLKSCDLTEAQVTEDNVNIVIRGMRVRYEEVQKVGK